MFFNLSSDVAIDLGTANTLIYIRGRGIVLNEPSIVAVHRSTREVLATGYQALQMHERTHKEIETIRPLKDGVIADFEVAEQLIRGLIRKVQKNWMTTIRRMVVCVPSGITEVEKRAVRDSAEHAGARQVYLIDEPMAAAIGIGLNVAEPVGNMIVDIGGGTTEIAIIALNGIVIDESIRVGGDEIDRSIVQYFKRNHNLLIGSRTAERIKREVGSAIELDPELELSVKGRDLVSGIPKVRTISSEDVREALRDSIGQIVSGVIRCLERDPARARRRRPRAWDHAHGRGRAAEGDRHPHPQPRRAPRLHRRGPPHRRRPRHRLRAGGHGAPRRRAHLGDCRVPIFDCRLDAGGRRKTPCPHRTARVNPQDGSDWPGRPPWSGSDGRAVNRDRVGSFLRRGTAHAEGGPLPPSPSTIPPSPQTSA